MSICRKPVWIFILCNYIHTPFFLQINNRFVFRVTRAKSLRQKGNRLERQVTVQTTLKLKSLI